MQILQKYGYHSDHQTGSLIFSRNINPPHRRVTFPNHKEIAKGALIKIHCETGITNEEFNKLA